MQQEEKNSLKVVRDGDILKNNYPIILMPDSFNFPWHVVCSSGLYVLDLIFPKRCVSCGRLGKYICQQCLAKIEFTVHPICPVCSRLSIGGITHPRCQTACGIDGMFALARYRGPLKDAIHLIK